MIENVPGNASRCVALRPAFLDERRAIRGSLNRLGDGGTKFREPASITAIWRRETKSELSDVGALGVAHVIGHLVAVTAAAARALAKFGW
jgi:hypothetical protein